MGVHYNKADFITYGKPSLFLDFANKKSLVDRISGNNLITFSRNSIGTYVGSDGLIKTASANEARFDHDPVTGESLGLLIEESRTNLSPYSETLNNWLANGVNIPAITVTPNAAVAPNGTLTADVLSQSTDAGSNRWIASLSNYTYTSGVTYTLSIWLKKISGTDAQPQINLFVNGFTNQSVGTLTTDWVRYSATFTASTTSNVETFTGLIVGWNTNGEANNFTFAAWGFQVEVGAFPTSYIPTTSAEVTRSADEASITGSNFSNWFNNSRGTFYVHAVCDNFNWQKKSLYYNGTGWTPIALGTGSPDAGRVYLINQSVLSNNTINASLFQYNGAATDFGPNTQNLITVSQNTDKVAAYSDPSNQLYAICTAGVLSKSNTNNGKTGDQSYTLANMMQVGYTSPNYSGAFSGVIKRISYYPFLLTDAQLQSLTS